MKKLLFICTAVLLFGCTSKKTQGHSNTELQTECEQALHDASRSTLRNRNILLGFKFGMTPDEVATHFSELKQAGKIYTSSNYGPTYKMTTGLGEIVCSFGTEFYRDSLIGMYLYLQKRQNVEPSLDLPGIRKLGAMELFRDKPDWDWYVTENDDYYFINGNIVIGITETPEAMVYYFDAPTKKRKTEEEKESKAKAIQKSVADL